MKYVDLELEIGAADRVAVITLNRPQVHNALNEGIRLELNDATARVAADDSVGALVLTGSGTRSFSVGADLKSPETNHSTSEFDVYLADQARTGGWYRLLTRFPKPVVAAVNGYAAGSGLQLALTADVLVGSETATFWVPQISLGLAPHVGTLVKLARIIGQQRMLRMVLTGERIDAQQALAWGLLGEVVPPDQLLPTARRLAGVLAAQPPLALRMAKESYFQAIDMPWDQAMAFDSVKAFGMWQTADRRKRHADFLNPPARDERPTDEGRTDRA